ncbi:MAG: ATP synthase F1 subunit epsilon [Candidatus Kerfeldbacteria bacterium]|nr:ATP synthase F1 subunit epsilon [Candidatus Kerfeldbacteria bacterium]
MATSFRLVITTPERVVYENVVESVTLPTTEGEITVLAQHMPLVAVLKPGAMIIRQDSQEHPYAIGGGFVEVDGQKLTVLADTAEHVEEIDEQRAEEARQRAEQLKQAKHVDVEEYAGMLAKLERDLARLHVIRRFRHRGHHGITHEGVRPE